MKTTTTREQRRDLIFALLVSNPAGVTIDDMIAEIDTTWALTDSGLYQAARMAIFDLRELLGDSDDINLVCEPQGYGQRWLYRFVGTLDEARPWAQNRLDDADTRLHTVEHVMRSIVAATKGSTREGRKARVIERALRRMREDLTDIEFNGAITP